MFNMDIPIRSRKGLARAQQMRGLTRRRNGPSMGMFDDMFGPSGREMLQRNFQAGNFGGGLDPLGRDPLGRDRDRDRDRFEDLVDSPPRPSRSQSGSAFDYHNDYASGPRVPFETAANNLLHALNYAISYCETFETTWTTDVRLILPYASDDIIDDLWAARIDWNGLPAGAVPVTGAPPAKAPKTFEEMRLKIRKAFGELRNAGTPRPKGPPGASDGPEDVALMMKKLATSCQGVVELMEAVRKYRSRMSPLVKELLFIETLLKDHEGLWARPVRRENAYEDERYAPDSAWSH